MVYTTGAQSLPASNAAHATCEAPRSGFPERQEQPKRLRLPHRSAKNLCGSLKNTQAGEQGEAKVGVAEAQ